jgi:hypothetical protein
MTKVKKQVSARKRWFIPWSPREPTGTNNEIARSVPFELHGEYHNRLIATVTFRQHRGENVSK